VITAGGGILERAERTGGKQTRLKSVMQSPPDPEIQLRSSHFSSLAVHL
jgi:hypothetical protein